MAATQSLRAGPAARALPRDEATRGEPHPPLEIKGGSLELLKWIALVCMTLDHINKYVLGGRYEPLFVIGRLAMPIFAVVLGFNLARAQGTELKAACRRTQLRLVAAGSAASVPFVLLGGLGWGWWPLNIMFTFIVAASAISLAGADGQRLLAALVIAFGGAFVEFWWPGVALCVAAWAYARCRSPWRLAAMIGACASTTLIGWLLAHQAPLNAGGLGAVAALAVVWAVLQVDVRVPRLRRFFYLYYPAHLAVIWAITRGALT